MSATEHLRGLRERLARLDARALEIAEPALAQLDALASGPADPDAASELLDQLEDLLEALMHRAGWPELAGGSQ